MTIDNTFNRISVGKDIKIKYIAVEETSNEAPGSLVALGQDKNIYFYPDSSKKEVPVEIKGKITNVKLGKNSVFISTEDNKIYAAGEFSEYFYDNSQDFVLIEGLLDTFKIKDFQAISPLGITVLLEDNSVYSAGKNQYGVLFGNSSDLPESASFIRVNL